MGFWKRLRARTGKLYGSDGDIFNEADWMSFEKKHSFLWQTINNGAAELCVRRATVRVWESSPMIRIQRTQGGGAYTLSLNVLVWEEDA